MKQAKSKQKTKGYSLIELLVFITIMSIALVTIVATMTHGTYTINDAKLRQKAAHVNSEYMEWIRAYRDICGYTSLESKGSQGGTTYCVRTLNYDLDGTNCASVFSLTPTSVDSCLGSVANRIDSSLYRTVTIVNPNPTAINQVITVRVNTFWNYYAGWHNASSSSEFSNVLTF